MFLFLSVQVDLIKKKCFAILYIYVNFKILDEIKTLHNSNRIVGLLTPSTVEVFQDLNVNIKHTVQIAS